MTTTTATQLTPLFEYLIRGDTLIFPPIRFTKSIMVPEWTPKTQIFSGECIRGRGITEYYFQCTETGITGNIEPDWEGSGNINDTIIDGTVEFTNKGKLFLTTSVDIAEQPISISGWKFFVTFKTNQDDADEDAQAAYEYTFPDSDEAGAGRGNIVVPASIMIGLIPGAVYMDVQIIVPYGNDEDIIKTFGLGKIKCHADISKRII